MKKIPVNYLFCLIILTLLVLFSYFVIKDFSGHLTGGGDIDAWEYTGYYFSRNFSFTPFPNLNLINNQVFYPYGTNSVFQSWGFERDIFYSVFSQFFGTGPLLQIYYLISMGILTFGSFLLLKKDFGEYKAFFVSLFIGFLNFYAVNKYPFHLNICVYHWTALGMLTDFIILFRFHNNSEISFKLLLLRGLLLILSFGQELGYITGFGLTSFMFCSISLIINAGYQFRKNKTAFRKQFAELKKKYSYEILLNWKTNLLFTVISLLLIFLYFPLTAQIVHNSGQFPKNDISQGVYWASPIRLMLPILFNQDKTALDEKFSDVTESIFDSRPGYFLLFWGLIGLWQSRKKLSDLKPFIILFLLCIIYHPVLIPIMKIFPWFSFNRVAGRSTVIYPVLLSIFFLKINFQNIKPSIRRIMLPVIIFVGILETSAAYSQMNYQPYIFKPGFFQYMELVKKQPGEAVLDFPFCVASGNGVGSVDKLCPYYELNSEIYSYKRFHNKKVIGQYFGRLHPKQIEPYIQAGWNKLFSPDNPDFNLARKQTRCFDQSEWDFFTKQYLYSDFAGINLYTDLLPEKCAGEFYRRFGNPVSETEVPLAGKVKFIPKPISLRNQVNPESALKIVLFRELSSEDKDLLKINYPKTVNLSGIGDIEENIRWSNGSLTKAEFNTPAGQPLQLIVNLINYPDNQQITVTFNDKKILEKETGYQGNLKIEEKLISIKGKNTLKIEYSEYYNFRKIANFIKILKRIYDTEGIRAINLKNIRLKTRGWKNKAVKFTEFKIIKY